MIYFFFRSMRDRTTSSIATVRFRIISSSWLSRLYALELSTNYFILLVFAQPVHSKSTHQQTHQQAFLRLKLVHHDSPSFSKSFPSAGLTYASKQVASECLHLYFVQIRRCQSVLLYTLADRAPHWPGPHHRYSQIVLLFTSPRINIHDIKRNPHEPNDIYLGSLLLFVVSIRTEVSLQFRRGALASYSIPFLLSLNDKKRKGLRIHACKIDNECKK